MIYYVVLSLILVLLVTVLIVGRLYSRKTVPLTVGTTKVDSRYNSMVHSARHSASTARRYTDDNYDIDVSEVEDITSDVVDLAGAAIATVAAYEIMNNNTITSNEVAPTFSYPEPTPAPVVETPKYEAPTYVAPDPTPTYNSPSPDWSSPSTDTTSSWSSD